MPNVTIFPVSLARSIATAVAAAPSGSKGQSGCAILADALGAGFRLRIRNGSTVVVDATYSFALAASNGAITLPAYSTLTTYIASTLGAGWTARIGKADDSVYVEGAVGASGSAAPFILSSNPAAGRGFSATGLQLRFDSSLDSQSDWLTLLYNSIASRSVNERIDGYVAAQDGSRIPFPDSYAGVVSYDGIVASLTGRDTGAGGDPLFFANGMNAAAIWGWFGARRGHTATQSRIRVSDFALAILRKSTGQWVIPFRGMRGWGARYPYLNAPSDWGGGQDTATDPNATYIAPTGSQTIELWPQRTPSSSGSYVDFFGLVDRDLFADMLSWTIACRVRVEGPDRASARFVGCIGIDFYRNDHAGRRYWPSGLPQYVVDGGGSEWQDIRNDGQDQWLVCPGVWELGRLRVNRPPWGNWDGVWPYGGPPYGLTWAGFQANPPPDLRALSQEYAAAMTAPNDFPPGNSAGSADFATSLWPRSSDFQASPYGSNVDPIKYGQSEPGIGQTDAGYIITRRAASGRYGDRAIFWLWLMGPKGYLSPSSGWRVQVRDAQAAHKLDNLSAAWTLFYGPAQVPSYGNNSGGGLRVSGIIDNYTNSSGIFNGTAFGPYASLGDANTNLIDARFEASGGISFKNFAATLDRFQVEFNLPDPAAPLNVPNASSRVVALAAVMWARLIPDGGTTVPSGVRVGAMLGLDIYDASGRVGTPGQGRLVQLTTDWRPIVVAYVLQNAPPSQPMSPSQVGSWLSVNPPPFV